MKEPNGKFGKFAFVITNLKCLLRISNFSGMFHNGFAGAGRLGHVGLPFWEGLGTVPFSSAFFTKKSKFQLTSFS